MNPRSLTFRLGVWYCGLLLLAGGSFALYTYMRFSFYLRHTMQDTLSTRAADVLYVAAPLLNDPAKLANAIEHRFAPEVHGRFIRLSLDRKVVYASNHPADVAFEPNRQADPTSVEMRLEDLGEVWLYTRSARLPDGRALRVDVGQFGEMTASARHGLVRTLTLALPGLLIVSAFGGYLLVQRSLSPVTEIIRAAEALTFNSPRERLPVLSTGDQLDELSRTLNRMLERLANAYKHASRFSADAAHELRTPLSVMRGELEFLTQRKELTGEAQAALTGAFEETARLGHIVESLLTLASLESVDGKSAHWPVDLRALVIETIDQMKLLAEDKEIDLACIPGPRVVTLGDRNRLKQVIVNLLDNAIKYTAAGGKVSVNVRCDNEGAWLEVTDTGSGIPEQHLEDIFNRFFRVDPDRGTQGAGLGLAITRSICAAHGGRIDVSSQLHKGSTFRVNLPVAPDCTPVRAI